MAHTSTLDETDILILRELQQNSRLTNKELAARIHLSTTPTFERTRRLERDGYIKLYTAIIDADRIDRGFTVLCNISTNNIFKDKIEDFREQVSKWDEVTECFNVSGEFDFVMKVSVSSMKAYQEFIINKVGAIQYISKIQSTFIMDTLKMSYGVKL
ncbi:MAG: Lrp/AsnC family transcriptional regulator [Salinivirgaceae bacterium]|nr:Lrp/AsnC family transcriptional regulator [Salinivirgaceae bacterium]